MISGDFMENYYFLENSFSDFDDQKICYGTRWYNARNKLCDIFY